MSVAVAPMNYDLLTQPERAQLRAEYVKAQGGMCSHCGEPLGAPPSEGMLARAINLELFPPNFLRYPVHLHHDHETGMTLGAVHARCNAVLWQYHRK